jgi:hypothetical protein
MKMSCEQMSDQVMDLLYGELPVAERPAVEAHLAGCERCRAEVEAFRQTRAVVRDALDEPVPARAHASILRAAAEQAGVQLAALAAAHETAAPAVMRARTVVAAAAPAARAPAPAPAPARSLVEVRPPFWERLRRRWALPTLATVGAVAVFVIASRVFFQPEATFERGRSLMAPPTVASAPAPEPTPELKPPPAPLAVAASAPPAEEPAAAAKAAPPVHRASAKGKAGGTLIMREVAEEAAAPPPVRHAKAHLADDPLAGLDLGPAPASPPAAKPRASVGATDDLLENALSGRVRPGAASAGGRARRLDEDAPSKRELAPRSSPAVAEGLSGEANASASGAVGSGVARKLDRQEAPSASERAAASGELRRFAAPPPPRGSAPAAPAPAPPAASAAPESQPFAAAPAPMAAPASAPAPARRAVVAREKKAVAADDDKEMEAAAPRDGADGEKKKMERGGGETLVQRADRLFAGARWAEAAAAYRELIRQEPHAADAGRWRQRLYAAEKLLRDAQQPREAAPAAAPPR